MIRVNKIYERGAGLDGPLLTIIAVLLSIGIIMVFSATMLRSENDHGTPWYHLIRHVLFICIGIVAGFGASLIPPKVLPRLSLITIAAVGVLLMLVFVPGIGEKSRGACRWISLFGIRFQPSELAKVALPLFMASVISFYQDKPYRSLKVFGLTLPVVAATIGLVALEPDYGTAGMLMLVCGSIYFVAEFRPAHILALSVLILPGSVMAYKVSPHFRERILAFIKLWIDPSAPHWQIDQAFTAIGSGGFWGLGLGNGMHKHLILAESFNDFALASIAEEGGFVAASLIIGLLLYAVMRSVIMSLLLKSNFARLLAFGLCMSIGIQGFMNICVVLGLMPITGINLPFISYGGSGMLVNLVTAGLLLSMLGTQKVEGVKK